MRVFGFQESGCGDPALEAYVGMHHIYVYIYIYVCTIHTTYLRFEKCCHLRQACKSQRDGCRLHLVNLLAK